MTIATSASASATSVVQRASGSRTKINLTAFQYPSGYRGINYGAQLDRLRRDLGITLTGDTARGPARGMGLPQHAEHFFAIPDWGMIASNQNEALKIVLAALARKLGTNFAMMGISIDDQHMREHDATTMALLTHHARQPRNKVRMLPAQFGARYKGGQRLRDVRSTCLGSVNGEFGLNAYTVAVMLLTHPERLLTKKPTFCIRCPGTEYSIAGDGDFASCPIFGVVNGQIRFTAVKDVLGGNKAVFGAATGFVLPELIAS